MSNSAGMDMQDVELEPIGSGLAVCETIGRFIADVGKIEVLSNDLKAIAVITDYVRNAEADPENLGRLNSDLVEAVGAYKDIGYSGDTRLIPLLKELELIWMLFVQDLERLNARSDMTEDKYDLINDIFESFGYYDLQLYALDAAIDPWKELESATE